MTTLQDKARLFRSLHRPGRPLALANAWDVPSARLVEAAGAPAVATTSAGVAWSVGVADGDHIGRDAALAAAERIAAAVDVPVTADIESGFGATPDDVARTVRDVVAAGAVGVNIEDVHPADPSAQRPAEQQAERISAARRAADDAGGALYVNARADAFLRSVGEPGDRLPDTLERAAAYIAAGADGVFVPGVTDPDTVGALVRSIDAPLNILAGPGAPDVATLAALGVARVSLGSAVTGAAYAVVRRSARELFDTGTYTSIDDHLSYGELNALMLERPATPPNA
ncbi:2-methylisocitrate lyase-like PEP mutase family enzyme [Haloactinopolyspora alba]|uniref:2-methylisocitrate lyase-like PEP mutase family enzyme n=2 Tax=Haloactinopolyspora alba TaxID=648780 RepID=A0A2P8E502_9ACTN|nr:isocitrate lyase/phosphoenolpyruvate mutase family protein [Haloactinopolyspora alba]PSL04543.1 2-methylisocitrate lyase-like PEP mutase family enzyme [Haloactinopolyspora alba]